MERKQRILYSISHRRTSSQPSVDDKKIELVDETKLLGTHITKDLKWNKNTKELIKKGFTRMQILNRAAGFTSNIEDLKSIYLIYVRSVVEQSAVVWHSSLTYKNRRDLERVQRCAVRVILKNNYKGYKSGLKTLRIQTLKKRREMLCLKFAKNCLKDEKLKKFFPVKKSEHK